MTKRDLYDKLDRFIAEAIAIKLGPDMVKMPGIDVVGRAAVGLALLDENVRKAILNVGVEPDTDASKRLEKVLSGELEVPDLPKTEQPESLKRANEQRAKERELAKEAIANGNGGGKKKQPATAKS